MKWGSVSGILRRTRWSESYCARPMWARCVPRIGNPSSHQGSRDLYAIHNAACNVLLLDQGSKSETRCGRSVERPTSNGLKQQCRGEGDLLALKALIVAHHGELVFRSINVALTFFYSLRYIRTGSFPTSSADLSQNEYIEEHIKRHGRRLDHFEKKFVSRYLFL